MCDSYYSVFDLLFRWQSVTEDHVKRQAIEGELDKLIMAGDKVSSPGYIESCLELAQKVQTLNTVLGICLKCQ